MEPMKKKCVLPDASPVSDQVCRQHFCCFPELRKGRQRPRGATLGHCPDTVSRAALWHRYLDQPGCISHLSPSSATAKLTRACDGACSGFQHIRNNANDIICFVCIMVWCLENKHLGFVSMFMFNKYFSFVSTIISPQQTIIQ